MRSKANSMLFVGIILLLVPYLATSYIFSRVKSTRIAMERSMFQGIAGKLGSIVELVSGQTKITESNIEDTLKEVKNILVDADVNLQVANTLIKKVKEKTLGMKVDSGKKPGEQFIALLAQELVDTMGAAQTPLTRRSDGRPNIILMAGLQGAGKTTAAAKLANWATKQSYAKKILLIAADVYRPAAIDQLKLLGQRLSVDVYSEDISSGTANPVQICRRGVTKAMSEGYDCIIIDTAGRQVIDERLMDELKQIKTAILPDETLLVVDAMTGQEAATLTAKFNDDIGITGAILTKMDGDTRGGSALSVRGVSGKPIKFVGVGENMDDLEPFYPERMASRILGMGDIATLLEKTKDVIDIEGANMLGRKMQKGNFDFNDFMLQTQGLKKMGGMAGVLKMLPGAAGRITDEAIFETEKRIKRSETIILSMTDEERTNTDLLTLRGGKKELSEAAAKRRVDLANRSGMPMQEVENFILEFVNMKKMMQKNLKGIDIDNMSDPNTPVETLQGKKLKEKESKKIKPSRGGGGGFGAKSS